MAGRAAASSSNPLVISGRPDTSLQVQLHPLVLLTISDYITRHTIRQQGGLIVGGIIGQQNGRNFTLEHAFECKLAVGSHDRASLDADWFSQRLEMMKEVHKDPALDLVALFTLGPVDGPQTAHLPLLKQVQALTSSDSIMLLLFHPELVNDLQGGKLPITLYESVEEADGDQLQLRFKELAFDVDSGDAEMIGVNFVAVGSGNATAVPKAEAVSSAGASGSKDKKSKGKGKAKEKEGEEAETNGTANILSPEDDELLSTLNSKINAIKMLDERLQLIRAYLQTLPSSYLTDSSSTEAALDNTNFTLLRSINSMLSRLPLLAPPVSSQDENDGPLAHLKNAAETEKQDVYLTSLLASVTRSISEAHSLGTKFNHLQRERASRDRNPVRGPRLAPFSADENMLGESGF